MGNAIASISGRVFLIEHAIGDHMLRINILQQRIAEALSVVERLQSIPAVVGHTGKIDADFRKLLPPLCQLDQLALTEGSPVS